MRWACVVSTPNWEVIRGSLEESGIDTAWNRDNPDDALALLATHPPDIVLVEARSGLVSAELVSRCDTAGIRLVALITGPDADTVADSLGIGERVRHPRDLSLIAQGLPPGSGDTAGYDNAPGELWAVWGPPGSPGRTTMAIAMCASLVTRGYRAVLVDADPRGGTVAPALGILDDVPGFIAACRLAKRGELNAPELQRLLSRYSLQARTMSVLTGLTRMMCRGEAPTASVSAVVEKLRESFDLVIVDAGSDLVGDSELSHAEPSDHAQLSSDLLSLADAVIAVAHASPTGVARLARSLPDATRLAPGRVHVWLNGVDPVRRALREEGVLAEALWRFAEVSDYSPIHRDDAMRHAVMAGVTPQEIPGKHPALVGVEAALQRVLDSRGMARVPQSTLTRDTVTPPTLSAEVWKGLQHLWKKVTAVR